MERRKGQMNSESKGPVQMRGTVIFTVKLLTLTVSAPRSKAYNLGKEAMPLIAKCQRNRGNLRKLSKAHLCPEMHAVTKIADLTTFRQTD